MNQTEYIIVNVEEYLILIDTVAADMFLKYYQHRNLRARLLVPLS